MSDRKICLICELPIPLYEEPCSYHNGIIEGGSIKVSFGFGSQYDWLGLTKPKYHATDPILKDKIGYLEHDSGELLGKEKTGITVYIPNETAKPEYVPCDNIPEDREDLKIASNADKIKAHICDSCFAKKIKLFHN